MKAVVVYESHWGNTEAVARAIAEGIGPEARALNTDEATGPAVDGAELVVAGSPVMAFSLPREGAGVQLANDERPRGRPTSRIRCSARGSKTCRRPRLRGGVRDPDLVVAAGCDRDDRVQAREGGLPAHREGRAVHRRGRLRAASRGRARAGPRVGRGAARAASAA